MWHAEVKERDEWVAYMQDSVMPSDIEQLGPMGNYTTHYKANRPTSSDIGWLML